MFLSCLSCVSWYFHHVGGSNKNLSPYFFFCDIKFDLETHTHWVVERCCYDFSEPTSTSKNTRCFNKQHRGSIYYLEGKLPFDIFSFFFFISICSPGMTEKKKILHEVKVLLFSWFCHIRAKVVYKQDSGTQWAENVCLRISAASPSLGFIHRCSSLTLLWAIGKNWSCLMEKIAAPSVHFRSIFLYSVCQGYNGSQRNYWFLVSLLASLM